MKKIFLIMFLVVCSFVQAQNYLIMHIEDMHEGSYHFCYPDYEGLIVYGEPGCELYNEWCVNGEWSFADSIVLHRDGSYFDVFHDDNCGNTLGFVVFFRNSNVSNPFSEPIIWKHYGETITLVVGQEEDEFDYLWSTGSTSYQIDVTQPGTYTVTITDMCGEGTFTVEVRDNVEIESASVDPSTNKNLVTWEVTPEQATYISNVTINRDGVDIATVPYTDGQFLDNIGSDLAARIYTIVGVCPDGTLCPIQSLSRGTIHMAFLPDINGNVEMTWNQPELGGANIHVGRFEICEYDPNSNEISVIDFVSSVTTSYSCNQSMFDYGYPLIRAIIQDGREEKDMLSNRTDELVGLNEMASGMLRVYPNPSNGVFTIDGSGTLQIINVIGQTIMTMEINGKETVTLPKGLYFVKLGDMTQKIVVE